MTEEERSELRELVDLLKRTNGKSTSTNPWVLLFDFARNVGVPAAVLLLATYFCLPPMVSSFTDLVDKTSAATETMSEQLSENSELLREAKTLMKDVPSQRAKNHAELLATQESHHNEHMSKLDDLCKNSVGKETAEALRAFKDVPAHHKQMLDNQETIIQQTKP